MTAYPFQLIETLLLGFFALTVGGLALYLLNMARRAPRTVEVYPYRPVPGAPRSSRGAVGDIRERRRKALLILSALLMLCFVFVGKTAVSLFYPAGQGSSRVSADARTMTVKGPSGADLFVAESGPPDAPTILFTHGWGADRRDWEYAISALPPGRFHVVVWDLPGLGDSSPTKDYDYAMSTLASDLDQVIASLKGRPVILVGHSIGGILNIEYARRFPEKMGREVIGLVQANTTFTNPVETKKNAERSRMLQKPVFEPLLHLISWMSPVARGLGWLAYQSGLAHLQLASQSFAGAESWDQLDEMARYAYRSSPRVVAQGVLGMMRWDGSDVLPKIRVPTLVISGNEDVTTLPAASDRMAHDIPAAERVSVERAAHLGPVEQYASYAKAISAFALKTRRSTDLTNKVAMKAPAR
jgi:pimeloyl-ACP methyl ester carboxylesterase